MAATIKHKIHRYQRATLGKNKKTIVYKCVIPGCTHYLYPEVVLGKFSLCNECGDPHILPDKLTNLRSRPVCEACFKKRASRIWKNFKREKSKKEINIAELAISKILGEE